MIDFDSSWENYLHLIVFNSNNNYLASFKTTPFGILYERKYKSPLYYSDIKGRKTLRPEIFSQTVDKSIWIHQHLKVV